MESGADNFNGSAVLRRVAFHIIFVVNSQDRKLEPANNKRTARLCGFACYLNVIDLKFCISIEY